jgi:transcriptional regulator with XRE-family HTH domain
MIRPFNGAEMSRTLGSQRHKAMWTFLINKRKKAGLSQYEVAKRLGRWQSYVARVESGQRRLDLMELLDFAEALEFDIRELVRHAAKVSK